MKNETYNGWSSWNSWNVSLWIHNDHEYYTLMMDAIRSNPDLNVAVAELQSELPCTTPDDADFVFLDIREAIEEDHGEYWDV